MGIWNNIKINTRGKDENNVFPDWRPEPFPQGRIEIIIESAEEFDAAVSDIINRMFRTAEIDLTPNVLKDILRFESEDYPEQFLLFYKNRNAGLVYTVSDMFSTFLIYDSQYKTFQNF